MRPRSLSALLALLLVAGMVLTATAGAQTTDEDSLFLVGDAEEPTGSVLSLRLSQATILDPSGIFSVNLASEQSFADAMSSSLLQTDGPLLLIPPALPLPGELMAELERLDPGLIRLLGGNSAIPDDVQQALVDAGYTVERIAGATRVDTAVQVATIAGTSAETVLIARAFGSAADPTQAWADSVTAGALSTQLGWPILLTDSASLSDATATYLANSSTSQVVIVGGPAAVSDNVRGQLLNLGFQVDRLGGQSRFETALLMSQVRGFAPGGRLIISDGTAADGWQAGLIAARHAATTGAAIVLTAGDDIPPVSEAFIEQAGDGPVTCLVHRFVCGGMSEPSDGGAPEDLVVSYNPPAESALAPGETIVVGVDDPNRLTTGAVQISPTDCISSSVQYLPEGSVAFSIGTSGIEEAGGDQGPPTGGTPTQPTGDGQADGSPGPNPTATAEPIEEPEPAPNDSPTACVITATFDLVDGGTMTDVVTFYVVDLRPRIRVTSFPQVEDRELSFQDRSGGLIDTWKWRFGDGGTSNLQHPQHTYSNPGCYDTSLEVNSPLTHWFTGRQFTDSVTRTLAVDPASASTARIEVQVYDGFEVAPGKVVELRNDDGLVSTATSGSDGRADFANVPNNGPAAPEEFVIFTVAGETESIVQTPLPGHTLCPKMQIGDVGSLDISVVKAENQEEGVAGAELSIVAQDFVFPGESDSNGGLTITDLPVATYTITVESPGRVTQEVQAEILKDASTAVTIPMPLV